MKMAVEPKWIIGIAVAHLFSGRKEHGDPATAARHGLGESCSALRANAQFGLGGSGHG
jgi:hypothetical protein